DAIEQSGGAWVVIGYEGEFSPEQPSVGDEVILGTRAIEYNSFFALREFWLTDLDHKHEYARIKAMFVMMNLEKRRLMRIPNELITPYKSTLNKRLAQLKAPSKLPDDFQEKEYQVRYFDIDLNHHVNNARYFDWMLDPLGAEFLRTHYPAYLTIKYENEVKEESTVQSRVHIDRDGDQVKTIHEIWSHGELCTMAEMTWNHI
ncbi:MAG: thioesterase, partial [Limosilactobacillus sp.]|uniref:acyl-[acyl-carrier-protein] thioesterase n=1 Tax=Limosilactobacillus sp. TaxID=2773925 RepID=UPI0026F93EC7|nr:thioesterase [Limosilactobacillus sp.]